MKKMLPVKGVNVWSPLQKHVYKVWKSLDTDIVNQNKRIIKYEMPCRGGSTTVIRGLIANLIQKKEARYHILLITTNASNAIVPIVDMLEWEPYAQWSIKNGKTLKSGRVRVDSASFTWLGDTKLFSWDWILIDQGDFELPERFYQTLYNIMGSAKSQYCKILWLYNKKEPIFFNFKCSTVNIPLYYPNATLRAIHTWLLCSKRLGVHRDVRSFITRLLKQSCHEHETWLHIEYSED
jgi:hypothetical protein